MSKVLSNEESIELLERDGHHEPKPGSWGIATKDSTTGGFWWFKNHDTLMDFISRALPSIETDPEEVDDFEDHIEVYYNYVEEFKKGDKDSLPILYHHNQYFSGDIELVWIGSFDELTQGNSHFSRFVREEFHDSNKAITSEEIEEFQEFVGEDVSYLGQFESLNSSIKIARDLTDDANANELFDKNSIILIIEWQIPHGYVYPLHNFTNLTEWKKAFPLFAFLEINDSGTEPDEVFMALVDYPNLSTYRAFEYSAWDFSDFDNFRKANSNVFYLGSISDILEKENEQAEIILKRWKEDREELRLEEFLGMWNDLYAV